MEKMLQIGEWSYLWDIVVNIVFKSNCIVHIISKVLLHLEIKMLYLEELEYSRKVGHMGLGFEPLFM